MRIEITYVSVISKCHSELVSESFTSVKTLKQVQGDNPRFK
jgi:hypothetical protein